MKRLLIALSFAAFMSSSVFAENELNKDLVAISTAVKAEEYDRALDVAKAFAKKDTLNNDFAQTLFEAGSAAAQKKQLAATAGFYRILVDKFPKSEHASTARAELAACYTMLRQLDSCIAQARANLELDPESQWVEYWHFLIAQSYFRLWDYPQAKTDLEAFLVKFPSGNYAQNAKSCLSQIDPPWKIDEHGIVSYSGKYDLDIRLHAIVKTLPDDMMVGFSMLEQRLGIDLKPHTNILFEYKDASKDTPGGSKASTFTIGRNNKPTTVVRFYTEMVVTDPKSYRNTVIHEMKHAGFLGIMGHSYDDLPTWIREGLAVWGSDNVADRVQNVLSNAISADQDPMTVLDGIEDPVHNERDYMEDGLAFDWLESKKAGNVKAFCRRLVKGESYREIWADLSGMKYPQAMTEANAYCQSTVVAALGDAYTSFAALKKDFNAVINKGADAVQKWLNDGGQARLEKWLTRNPGHVVEPFARLCLAMALINAKQYASGRELLQKVIDNDGSRCSLQDDAQLWIGLSYNHQQDTENMNAAFGVLLRDYTNSSSAKQVAGKFAPAGPVTR
jgi:tetratricopeptide (TPR) repeat protein